MYLRQPRPSADRLSIIAQDRKFSMNPEKIENRPPVAPLNAATVMLIRETPSANPFEVLLMRRHARQSFMAKAFVYPGGQMDDADRHPGNL